MFQCIVLKEIRNNISIYTAIDSCFTFDISSESSLLDQAIARKEFVEAIIYNYEARHLNVAKNLAHYYEWMIRVRYGSAGNSLLHSVWLDMHVKELQQSRLSLTTYHALVKQYLKRSNQ